MEDNKEWVSGLKEGDQVAVKSHMGRDTYYSLSKVKKVTPTGKIRIQNDMLFDRDGVCHDSAGWGSKYIMPVTDEILENLQRKEILYKLSKLNWSELNTDKLKRIMDIISE